MSVGTNTLYLTDETGNPVPPGWEVTLTDPLGNVQSGYTTANGAVPALTLVALTTYTVAFYAQRGPGSGSIAAPPQAPSQFALGTVGALGNGAVFDDGSYNLTIVPGTWTFTPPASGDATVAILGYRSPYLNADGYETFQAELFPTDRANPSGAPYTEATQAAVGAAEALISTGIQLAHAAMRIQSSSGAAIDSWVADFLGPSTLPRQSGEPDVTYIARVLQWLMLPFGTLYAIQQVVNSWLATASELTELLGPQTLDTSGALDTSGGLDGGKVASASLVVPKVTVFDWQSNPTLATAVGLIPATEAPICILLTFPNIAAAQNWALGQNFLGSTTFLATPGYYTLAQSPSPDLDALIRIVKVGGTTLVYVANTPNV